MTGARGQAAPSVQKALPFTMTQTETRVQTLPDGSTVTHVTIVRTAHDSQGRMRTERVTSGGIEQVRRDGDVSYMKRRPDQVQIYVSDPVAGTSMSWTDNVPGQGKVVNLNHVPPRQNMPFSGVERQPMLSSSALTGPEAEVRREDLGIKSLKGVYVRGTKTTMRYPAGFDGNTAAYTTTSESWRSDDLGGLVIEQSNSSLGTKSTTTLDSYVPGEPDAASFQAPAGYTVWDRTTGMTKAAR